MAKQQSPNTTPERSVGEPRSGEPPAVSKTIDPADVALAAAHGLNAADLSEDDLAELRAADDADAARTGRTPEDTTRALVRESSGNSSPNAISLMLEGCDIYGIDPRVHVQPVELLAWRFYAGGDEPGRVRPDAVILVTGGGLKLKHWDDPDEPLDPDTLDKLRRTHACYAVDEKTGKVTVLPLPADLRLPSVALTGVSPSPEHVYQLGYVKSGGREAAEEKQRRREQRMTRFASPDRI